MSRTISQTFRRAGYDVTAHQLRHWFGTHALRIAKDVRVAQELLRHASLQSTQIYTKVSDQRKAETIRRLSYSGNHQWLVTVPVGSDKGTREDR